MQASMTPQTAILGRVVFGDLYQGDLFHSLPQIANNGVQGVRGQKQKIVSKQVKNTFSAALTFRIPTPFLI